MPHNRPRLPSERAPNPRQLAPDVARRRYDLLLQSVLTGRGIHPNGSELGNDCHPPGVLFDDQLDELRTLARILGIEPPQTELIDWEEYNRAVMSSAPERRRR